MVVLMKVERDRYQPGESKALKVEDYVTGRANYEKIGKMLGLT